MARVVGIDYGKKRSGIAVTDTLQIIASPHKAVETEHLWSYLVNYLAQNEVEAVVIGEPRHADGNPTAVTLLVQELQLKLQKAYPSLEVALIEEGFSSFEAKQRIISSGAKRKKRRDKSHLDVISAVIILERYMESIRKF